MVTCSYLVMHLMTSDLNNVLKQQQLTDEHVQFLIYQILRGLKVSLWWVCLVGVTYHCVSLYTVCPFSWHCASGEPQ